VFFAVPGHLLFDRVGLRGRGRCPEQHGRRQQPVLVDAIHLAIQPLKKPRIDTDASGALKRGIAVLVDILSPPLRRDELDDRVAVPNAIGEIAIPFIIRRL
jgi:hypothetical protein